MHQRTLVLIKPDVVERDIWFRVMLRYVGMDLGIAGSKILTMTEALAKEFYLEHKDQSFFEELIEHMTSGPIIALEIIGDYAVDTVRHLNGATNPAEAESGTIRAMYGEKVLGPKNAVHGSDSPENAEREIALIFGD